MGLAQTVGAHAEPVLRLAVWGSELGRDGPGLLLRDLRAAGPDVQAARDLILSVRPDVLLLLHIDHDHRLAALGAVQALLAEGGHPMPHAYAPPPNAGLPSGLDLDGDGRSGTEDDAQGWARFQGAGGMAVLSRLPIDTGARDLSTLLWRDLPGARYPPLQGRVPGPDAQAVQRLSSTGHWIVPILGPDGARLTLLAWHAGPPAFGAVPGRNRARNHDETALWSRLLDGALPLSPPPDLTGPVVVIGNANLDPTLGDGDHAAIRALLAHPRLQDPAPQGARDPGTAASPVTADYAPPPSGPGPLRTSYILPDARLTVRDSGLVWPPPPARHALVWADLAWPPS
jgi:hypothetical protein